MRLLQAGITPLERRNEVAPKRGRPPKKPAPSAAVASDSGQDVLGVESSHKRQLPSVEPHDAHARAPLHEEGVEQPAAPLMQILMPPNE
jgi:hypothetical protein